MVKSLNNVLGMIAKITIIVCVVCMIIGCSSSDDDNGGTNGTTNGNDVETKMPVQFVAGTDFITTTQTIGSTGGMIEVTDSGTPLDGIKVEFPAGALSKDAEVSLGYNDGVLTPNSGKFSGVIIILDVPNVTQFEQPVIITAPFSDEETVPVPYYINDSGTLRPAQIVNVDRENGEFTFQTFHASFFTWLLVIETAYAPGPDDIVDTGYVPGDDGFQIVNYGSTYNRGGECFGMTSFSLWYFMNEKGGLGKFYPKYYNVLANDSAGNPLRGQNIIATRAFISITQQWNTYIPSVAREQKLSDADKYASIRNIILNTGNPVLIYLYQTSGTSAHSVLAYAFNHLDGKISIYDPNHPGVTKEIEYDSSASSFDTYSGYDGIIYNGDGSLNLTEPYQNILDDAESDFQRSGNATINITSHTNGEQTEDRNINLAGTIESGQVLVTKLTVTVGSTPFSANVGYDGSFNIPISLEGGINHLQFTTKGNDADGKLIDVPNNMATTDFTIDLDVPSSVILVTLTWDTNDTDVDLYVIDPTGDYSCFYHQMTSDGGELDYDITEGYGPEHWTLMSADTVRYDEPYSVRLHYYSDHDSGPTNYTVTIKVYEGTAREATYSYRGNLSVNNSYNDSPDGAGADWVDIASITLTEENSRSGNRGITADSEMVLPFITVPVPPREERIKPASSD